MDIISGIYSLYLKDRLGVLRDYAELAADIQSEQLSNLLLEAAETEWGRKYDFKTIFSYQEFRDRLPIQRMSDLKPYLDRIRSGETDLLWPGLPKDIIGSQNDTLVPITAQSIEENFNQGISDSFTLHLDNFPGSKLLEGYSANVGNGSQYPCMNEWYALMRENESFMSSLLSLPRRLGDDRDGNPSPELVLKEITGQKVTSFKGTPARLQELLRKAARKNGGKTLKDLWPDAEVLFMRSPSNSEEIKSASELLPEGLSLQATYCSPEGLIGIQDKPGDPSFLLMLDLSIFFEFIPTGEAQDAIVPLQDIEAGKDYRLVITSSAGLWRCCSEGPSLRFVSTNPYRFILI